jgi:hypothetical protein
MGWENESKKWDCLWVCVVDIGVSVPGDGFCKKQKTGIA